MVRRVATSGEPSPARRHGLWANRSRPNRGQDGDQCKQVGRRRAVASAEQGTRQPDVLQACGAAIRQARDSGAPFPTTGSGPAHHAAQQVNGRPGHQGSIGFGLSSQLRLRIASSARKTVTQQHQPSSSGRGSWFHRGSPRSANSDDLPSCVGDYSHDALERFRRAVRPTVIGQRGGGSSGVF
jgi:hypothetical protein